MKLTKFRLIIGLLFLFLLAGIVAEKIVSNYSDGSIAAPDVTYLFFLIGMVLLLIRLELYSYALVSVYGASIFFCFLYFFIAPYEAPIAISLFFFPAMLWQRKKISFPIVCLLGAIIVFVCWKILGRPIILALLFPASHLLAIRLSPEVSTRHSSESIEKKNKLSLKQKHQRKFSQKHFAGNFLTSVINEIEEFPDRIKDFWGDHFHEGPIKHQGKNSVLDLDLIRLQDSKIMSQALTDLKKRDNAFEDDEFIERIEKVFWKVQEAWYSQNIAIIQPFISDALFEQFEHQIKDQKEAGIKYSMNNMRIYETRIVQVNSDQNFDVINVFVRASSADSMLDIQTGEILGENQETRKFCEYWTFIRKPSAKTLKKPGLLECSCPNCSIPLKIGQATICNACQSFIRSGEYDWVLAKITQACEWEYFEPSLIPDWKQMLKIDPNFTSHQIEDRSAVIFWALRMSERLGSVDPARRFSTEALCTTLFTHRETTSSLGWDIMENLNLASTSLQGFKLGNFKDRAFMLIVWSGIPLKKDSNGKVVTEKRVNRVVKDVYVLTRNHGSKTNLETTLTSSHCPNCGGALSSSFAISCKYCDSILNEGNNNWILEKVVNENDPDYLKILNAKAEIAQKHNSEPQNCSARDLITIMAQILLADGKVAVEEFSLLEKIAAQYDMDESEINSIIYSLNAGQVYIPAPSNSKEAWNLLSHAVKMALCDGFIDEKELKCLAVLAKRIGYSNADLQRAIRIEESKRSFEEQENSH